MYPTAAPIEYYLDTMVTRIIGFMAQCMYVAVMKEGFKALVDDPCDVCLDECDRDRPSISARGPCHLNLNNISLSFLFPFFMANYLPVLLISVSTNTVPDDSSLSTLPRAQVDYLSHDWQEEDVWRSWRNMTRQKNEITNGMRLENASWRTWWKQRNKLKTVSPETLNW